MSYPDERRNGTNCGDVGDDAHKLLSELWSITALLRMSETAWSPTLRAHAGDLAAVKHKLESKLYRLRLNKRHLEFSTRCRCAGRCKSGVF